MRVQDEGQGVLHSSKSMMMIIDKICMDIIFFWNILFQKKSLLLPIRCQDLHLQSLFWTQWGTWYSSLTGSLCGPPLIFTNLHLSSEARVTFINSQRIFGALKHGIVPWVVSTVIWVLRPLNIVSMNWHSIYVLKSKIQIYL